MPELEAPIHNGKVFGLPGWAALGVLGAAGLVGYLLFFRNSGGGSSSSGQGTTGYSPYALAVMQNPDESASISAQNQLLQDVSNQLGGVGGQLTDLSGQVSGVGTSISALSGQVADVGAKDQAGLLAQMQSNFRDYAQAHYGYNASALGGQAGYLALPQSLQDYLFFLQNPNLANPAYQNTLLQSRGWVFSNTNPNSATGVSALPGPAVGGTPPQGG